MAILPVGIGPQEGGYQIERSLSRHEECEGIHIRTSLVR